MVKEDKAKIQENLKSIGIQPSDQNVNDYAAKRESAQRQITEQQRKIQEEIKNDFYRRVAARETGKNEKAPRDVTLNSAAIRKMADDAVTQGLKAKHDLDRSKKESDQALNRMLLENSVPIFCLSGYGILGEGNVLVTWKLGKDYISSGDFRDGGGRTRLANILLTGDWAENISAPGPTYGAAFGTGWSMNRPSEYDHSQSEDNIRLYGEIVFFHDKLSIISQSQQVTAQMIMDSEEYGRQKGYEFNSAMVRAVVQLNGIYALGAKKVQFHASAQNRHQYGKGANFGVIVDLYKRNIVFAEIAQGGDGDFSSGAFSATYANVTKITPPDALQKLVGSAFPWTFQLYAGVSKVSNVLDPAGRMVGDGKNFSYERVDSRSGKVGFQIRVPFSNLFCFSGGLELRAYVPEDAEEDKDEQSWRDIFGGVRFTYKLGRKAGSDPCFDD